MRITCQFLGRSKMHPAVWIAIYFSVFSSTATRHTASHLSLFAGVTSAVVTLVIATTAWFVCRKHKTA